MKQKDCWYIICKLIKHYDVYKVFNVKFVILEELRVFNINYFNSFLFY